MGVVIYVESIRDLEYFIMIFIKFGGGMRWYILNRLFREVFGNIVWDLLCII